jgi:hypothetical protein
LAGEAFQGSMVDRRGNSLHLVGLFLFVERGGRPFETTPLFEFSA